MTTQIEVRGLKTFDDVKRNNVNRGNVTRRTTVVYGYKQGSAMKTLIRNGTSIIMQPKIFYAF